MGGHRTGVGSLRKGSRSVPLCASPGRLASRRFRCGGFDERENTLNQLLVELDGFDGSSGVVLAREAIPPLEPALSRLSGDRYGENKNESGNDYKTLLESHFLLLYHSSV